MPRLRTLTETYAHLKTLDSETLRTVAFRAGHASTVVTGVVYSHMIRSSEEKAAQILENILDPMGNEQSRNIV